MKKRTLLIGLLSILSVNANAFSYRTPNVFGGYTTMIMAHLDTVHRMFLVDTIIMEVCLIK